MTPAPAANAPAASTTRAWAFAYTPATYRYRIVTSAQISKLQDATPAPRLPQFSTDTVRAFPSTTYYATLAIDSVSARVLDPPTPATPACDSMAARRFRVEQLIPVLPETLTTNTTWTDTSITTGCHGTIPASSTVIRTYTVLGDTVVDGARTVHVERADSISAVGEGTEGQHRILLSATGSGLAHLFFDPAKGTLVSVTNDQTTSLTLTVSGRASRFVQRVHEQVTLDRASPY